MDEVCLRFPHLIEQINKHLENKTLVQFKKISRPICKITMNHKTFWIRMIQSEMVSDFAEFSKDWKKVFEKSPVKLLEKMAVIVQEFFKKKNKRRLKSWSPMHIVSESGNLELCKHIAPITEDNISRCSIGKVNF